MAFHIKAKVKPSISVDVITTMQSDFFYALSGIRVKSNLYSSSSVETKIKVRGHKQVGITFDLPQDKNEIFSARSELIVMQDQEEISQHGIEYRQTNRTCTWPVIGESIGLQMCSQFSVPDLSKLNNSVVHPGLLLSGPINISMVLEKSDLSAKTFAFEYKWQQQKDDSQVSVIFHTPGSSIERRLTANFTRSLDLYNASLVFKNGNNKFLADGEYYKNPENRRLKFNLESNGVKNLQFEAQMNRTKDGTSYLYTPIFRLDVNGEGVTGMKGTIRVYEKLGICQNDIALVFETKKLQILVKGNFVQSETTTSTNMTVHYRV
uniref:Uncharacterized protein n=1 Tax=Megaselia scalaris TaxID=36166 RepID=T1GAX7_MEGSC